MNVRRSSRALVYVGVVAAVFGMSKVHAAVVADPPYDFTASFRFSWSLAFIAGLCTAAYGLGLPDQVRTRRAAVRASVLAVLVGVGAISLAQLALGAAVLPRFVVLGAAAPLSVWFFLCAEAARDGRQRAEDRALVVVVADPGEAEILADELARNPEVHARVVATVDATTAAGDGRRRPLAELVSAMDAGVVVLDRRGQDDERVLAQVASLHSRGVRVRTLTGFYEEWLGKLPVSELERVSLLFDIGEVHNPRYGQVKRLLDVAVASVALVALAVAIPAVWVGNRFANRGPLFFRQLRVGRNGATFGMLKFRTMAPASADEPEGAWTVEGDPRVTPFGRILRRSHLDELPQAVNILRGELTVVGPRPEQPRYVDELSEKLPFYDVRHLVRPGLTGWAQVKYGYAGSEADALEKLQYEFWYLRHQRLGLDMRILGRTVRHVLGGQGR